jgi:hypothetical protein
VSITMGLTCGVIPLTDVRPSPLTLVRACIHATRTSDQTLTNRSAKPSWTSSSSRARVRPPLRCLRVPSRGGVEGPHPVVGWLQTLVNSNRPRHPERESAHLCSVLECIRAAESRDLTQWYVGFKAIGAIRTPRLTPTSRTPSALFGRARLT